MHTVPDFAHIHLIFLFSRIPTKQYSYEAFLVGEHLSVDVDRCISMPSTSELQLRGYQIA